MYANPYNFSDSQIKVQANNNNVSRLRRPSYNKIISKYDHQYCRFGFRKDNIVQMYGIRVLIPSYNPSLFKFCLGNDVAVSPRVGNVLAFRGEIPLTLRMSTHDHLYPKPLLDDAQRIGGLERIRRITGKAK